MLDLMENQDRNLVKTIHQAAINYYSKNGITAEDRAEEIYHRLKLGEDPSSVGERWMTGVEDYLGDAIPEVVAARPSLPGFPSRSQAEG